MPDLCGALFILLIVLGAVTLVGHGLWVALAAIFGSSEKSPLRECPNCGSHVIGVNGRCRDCGTFVPAENARTPRNDWEAAADTLRRLRASGHLSESKFREIATILREERERRRRALGARQSAPTEKTQAPGPAHAEPESPPATAESAEAAQRRKAIELIESMEREEAAGEETPEPARPSSAQPTSPPKRDWGRVLQAFMEEKNIRWGELVSGLLIVGSAIGLVISLWSTLQETIPYFPALLFMLGTAAVHGAGLYTLKRWNLRSTSRGLLLISTLLIPLNFLAAIALSGKPGSPNYVAATSAMYIVAVTVGLLGYGVISFSAGRVFRKRLWWIVWIAVMVPSIGQLIIARQVEPVMSNWHVNLLAALPVGGFCLAVAAQLKLVSGGVHFPQRRCEQTFQVLGIAAFSLLMALGLLLAKSGDWWITVAQLAPPVSIVSAIVAAAGLLVQHRAVGEGMAGHRTAGTAVMLTGAVLMLIGLALAWPQPELLIAVGIVDVVALTGLALAARLAVLHVPAIAAMALTALTALHWGQGAIEAGNESSRALIDALLMGRSGLLLLGVAVVCCPASLVWTRCGRRDDGRAYLWGAASVGTVGLLVALNAGFVTGVDRPLTTPVFAAAALALFAVCRLGRFAWAAWCATLLLFVAFVHASAWNGPVMEFLSGLSLLPRHPAILSALLAATIAASMAAWLALRRRPGSDDSLRTNVINPLGGAAFAASALTIPGVLDLSGGQYGLQTGYLCWTAAVWGMTAAVMRSRTLVITTQALSFLAVWFGGIVVAQHLSWWDGNFRDPRYWQVQLGLQATWSLLWVVLRCSLRQDSLSSELLGRRKLNVDRLVLGGVVLGTAVLAIIGVLPGISSELQVVRSMTGSLSFADSLATAALFALALAAVVAASFATVPRPAAPLLAVIGVVAVTIIAAEAAAVTAQSFERAAGVSHVAASGAGTWIVLAVALVAVTLSLWERVSAPALCALVMLGAFVPVLIAAAAAGPSLPTATTLRFGLAAFALVLSLVWAFPDAVTSTAKRLGFRLPDEDGHDVAESAKATGYAVTLWPVLALTLHAGLQIARGNVIAGAEAEPLLGLGLSYAAPLWIFAAAMLTSALSDRSERFAVAASVAVQLGMALLFVLPRWLTVGHLGGDGLAELLQWSGIGLGVCTLLWIAGVRRIQDGEATEERFASTPFNLQFGWTVATAGLLSLWAGIAIFASPTTLGPAIAQLGHPLGFVVFGLAAASVALARRPRRSWVDALTGCFVLAMPLLAAAATRWAPRLEIADTWIAYHVLVAGWAAATLLLAVLSLLADLRAEKTVARALMLRTLAMGGFLLFLGMRAQWSDPQRPWWLVGTAATTAAISVAFGLVRRSQRFAYTSAGLVLLTTVAALSKPWIGLAPAPALATYLHVFEALLIATAGAGLFWQAVEVLRQKRYGDHLDPTFRSPPVQFAADGVVVMLTVTFAVWLLFARETANLSVATQLPWLVAPFGAMVLVSAVLLSAAALWDRRGFHALKALYATGLAIWVALLDGINAGAVPSDWSLELSHLWLGLGVIAAGYVALTGGLWGVRGGLARLSRTLGIPEELIAGTNAGSWLASANVLLAAFAVLVGFWSVLSFEEPALRYTAGAATAVLVPGLALLAQDKRAPLFRFVSLATAVVAGVQLCWAVPIEADTSAARSLQLAIRLLEVVSVATLLYAVGAFKLENAAATWGRSLHHASIAAGGTALLTLAVVLLMEGTQFPSGEVPVSNAQIAVISLILAALSAGLIVLAVVPGRDPLQLTERGRMGYVYAAELVASLLFLHIYLTKPELFLGILRPYWSYIVIGIAFVGVGLSEWFRRRELRVLSQPLERTGTFLPLLPVLAFWMRISHEQFDKYSLELLLAGLLYVTLASLRKSFVYSLAAAVLANFSLWSLYHHVGIALLTRPQMWLIPPALSLLTAAQLNKDRLRETQLNAIRYFSVLVIYISSTGEMFIQSAGDPRNLWHPMILAALSVAGILAGMLMRVRAFLYLGTGFLLLSIVSMVWHAARVIDEVWPWWVFGIVLGLAMLALFGMFEKKRDEVLGVLNRLKEWEP